MLRCVSCELLTDVSNERNVLKHAAYFHRSLDPSLYVGRQRHADRLQTLISITIRT
jgi:hypothetical protein